MFRYVFFFIFIIMYLISYLVDSSSMWVWIESLRSVSVFTENVFIYFIFFLSSCQYRSCLWLFLWYENSIDLPHNTRILYVVFLNTKQNSFFFDSLPIIRYFPNDFSAHFFSFCRYAFTWNEACLPHLNSPMCFVAMYR